MYIPHLKILPPYESRSFDPSEDTQSPFSPSSGQMMAGFLSVWNGKTGSTMSHQETETSGWGCWQSMSGEFEPTQCHANLMSSFADTNQLAEAFWIIALP